MPTTYYINIIPRMFAALEWSLSYSNGIKTYNGRWVLKTGRAIQYNRQSSNVFLEEEHIKHRAIRLLIRSGQCPGYLKWAVRLLRFLPFGMEWNEMKCTLKTLLHNSMYNWSFEREHVTLYFCNIPLCFRRRKVGVDFPKNCTTQQ